MTLFQAVLEGFIFGVYLVFVTIPPLLAAVICFLGPCVRIIEIAVSNIMRNIVIDLRATDISFKVEEENTDEEKENCS